MRKIIQQTKNDFKIHPEDSIIEFKGIYEFLSNYYKCKVTYNGLTYKSSEAAYQAQKCYDPDERIKFIDLDPSEAKHLGRNVVFSEKWDNIKYDIMFNIVKAKFDQNPRLRRKLIRTGDRYLIEGNTWGDKYWGMVIKGEDYITTLSLIGIIRRKHIIYLGDGDNKLGKI